MANIRQIVESTRKLMSEADEKEVDRAVFKIKQLVSLLGKDSDPHAAVQGVWKSLLDNGFSKEVISAAIEKHSNLSEEPTEDQKKGAAALQGLR